MFDQKTRDNLKACISDNDDNWRFFDICNCYSYALKLQFDYSHLRPGEISGREIPEHYEDWQLVEYVQSDLETLGYTLRESTLEEKILHISKEWKIAILNVQYMKKEYYDFHFVREDIDMQWYQKFSGQQFPTHYDEDGEPITDPEKARYDFFYHLVGYYVISKKQN